MLFASAAASSFCNSPTPDCASASCFSATAMRSAIGGGLALSSPTRFPSSDHTRTCPLQSPPITRSPASSARSAMSPNASLAMSCLPAWSHTRTILSRPLETSRPSGLNATLCTPPLCPLQLLISRPRFASHSLIVASSLADATTPVMNDTPVTAPLCPASTLNSLPLAASHTITPPLRSPLASSLPSGEKESAVTQSVCFLIE